MSIPKRIQRQGTKGWRMPEDAVYVGNPSRWGNPFKAEKVEPWPSWGGPAPWQVVTPNGRVWEHAESRVPVVGRPAAGLARRWAAASAAVELFALHIGPMGNYEYDDLDFRDLRRDLAGRDLACWCPLDQPCHADVLLEIANAPTTTDGDAVTEGDTHA